MAASGTENPRNGRAAMLFNIVAGGLPMERRPAVLLTKCREKVESHALFRNGRLTSSAYHPCGNFSVLKVLFL
jgi:hypothetical protein